LLIRGRNNQAIPIAIGINENLTPCFLQLLGYFLSRAVKPVRSGDFSSIRDSFEDVYAGRLYTTNFPIARLHIHIIIPGNRFCRRNQNRIAQIGQSQGCGHGTG